MSWRDKLQTAQLGDASFFVESHTLTSGRRQAVHEYPFRDLPYAEDLGRSARTFSLEAYVMGDDYFNARNTLIGVLEKEGPTVLVHPYFGRLKVVVNQYRQRESTDEGGIASFTIELMEAGENIFPQATSDTQKTVRKAADRLRGSAITDFLKRYSLATQPQDLVNDVRAEIERVLISVRGVIVPVAQLIALPGDLAAAIYNGLNNLSNTLKEPRLAFERLGILFNAGNDAKPVPQNTPRRKQQRNNQAASHDLIRRAALTEAARASASIEFASVDESVQARNTLVNAIDDLQVSDALGDPVQDDVFESLTQLREVIVNDIKLRGAVLPRITTHTSQSTLPALVIAYQLYGDARQDISIINRNNVRRPGFVQGGQALEVLTNE